MPNVSDSDEILSRLFGSVSRARILEFLVSHAGRTFYQREIMFETGLSLHPAQRELKNLYDLGIIKEKGAWGQASTINTSQYRGN